MSQTTDTSNTDGSKALHGNLIHLLREKFGPGHDLKTWVQEQLGISSSAAYRKLNSSGLGMDEMELFARGLDMSIEALYVALGLGATRVVNASYEIAPNTTIDVNAYLGSVLVNPANDLLVAFEFAGRWTVGRAAEKSGVTMYEVKSIAPVLTRTIKRTVALLDDEPMVVEQGQALLKKVGLESIVYTNGEDLTRALETERFDAFVLDWWLGDHTSEALIRTIRETEHGKTAPICIVSGEVGGNPEDIEADLVRVSKQYTCTARIKPIRWKLLGNDFAQILDEHRATAEA